MSDISAPLFAVACPACGRSLAATTTAAGRAAACPCCRARFLLPVAAAITVSESGSQAGNEPRGELRPPAVPPAAAAEIEAKHPMPIVGDPLPTFDIPADLFGDALAAAIVPAGSRILDGEAARQMEATVGERRARDRRRGRRSLLMLVIGSAILLGIVFWFTGFGARR